MALSDILAVASLYGLSGDEAKRDLIRVVRVMDRTYFVELAKKSHG